MMGGGRGRKKGRGEEGEDGTTDTNRVTYFQCGLFPKLQDTSASAVHNPDTLQSHPVTP